ncbi:MAG TPA: NTP transferase domain-containing protein [Bellilinea sp.]
MYEPLNAVILAAGFGKRMQSSLPKVLHPLAGVPMLEHSLRAAAGVTSELPVVVIGHGAEQVRQTIGEKARFVLQEQQLGTAHALQMAEPQLAGQPGLVLVTTGDMPLLTSATFLRLIDIQRNSSGPFSMLSVVLPDPHGFGRVVRGSNGAVNAIVEEAQATPEILAIRELNASVYCFDNAWLWDALRRIKLSPKGEYYLTDVVSVAVEEELQVQALIADDPQEALGINTREHLAEAAAVLRKRINSRWMLEGVSMVDPASTYIDVDVSLGRETLLLPGTSLQGKTVIGDGCNIGPDVKIVNSTLGAGCQVLYSVVEESQLPDGALVGPFTHLRNGQVVPSQLVK